MAFVREIGGNDLFYSGIWLRHMSSNRIESYRYIRKSIAIIQIKKRRDINDIPINNCALQESYSVSNRIESKNISINRVDKILYQ